MDPWSAPRLPLALLPLAAVLAAPHAVADAITDRALPFKGYRGNKSIGIDTCALGDTNGDGKADVAVHLPAMEEVRILSGVDYQALVTVRTSPLLMHNVKR